VLLPFDKAELTSLLQLVRIFERGFNQNCSPIRRPSAKKDMRFSHRSDGIEEGALALRFPILR
jgi:hypothetical protein